MDECWTVKKADLKKNGFTSIVLEESCTDTPDQQKDKQVGPRVNEA